MNKVTVSEFIQIDAGPDVVWDYTQDWRRRREWDRSVIEAEYLSEKPPVTVQVKGAGGLDFKVIYKITERPRLTTLAMTDLNSFWLRGGGGSWKYEPIQNQTIWTQHNTLVLRDDFLGWFFRPVFAFVLAITTRQLMKRAKFNLERRI
jgi:hypothetical protein